MYAFRHLSKKRKSQEEVRKRFDIGKSQLPLVVQNHQQWLFCSNAFLFYLSHTNIRNTRGVLGLLEVASTCREAHRDLSQNS